MIQKQFDLPGRQFIFSLCVLLCLNLKPLKDLAQRPPPISWQTAHKAFVSAVPIVTGGDLSELKFNEWQQLLVSNPAWLTKYNDGLKFTDAVDWLKERISDNAAGADRGKTIDNAFIEVYGRASTPVEQAYWEPQVKAKKAWYATIVPVEIKKLNASKSLRTDMVKLCYNNSLGRYATQQDLDYWVPRVDHCKIIREYCRAWLYSSEGAADLVHAIKYALYQINLSNTIDPQVPKSDYKPSDVEIKKAMVLYTKTKKLFIEMMAVVPDWHL